MLDPPKTNRARLPMEGRRAIRVPPPGPAGGYRGSFEDGKGKKMYVPDSGTVAATERER